VIVVNHESLVHKAKTELERFYQRVQEARPGAAVQGNDEAERISGATPQLIRDLRWTVPADRALQLFHTAGGGPQPYAQQMLARSPAYTTVFERLTCKSLGV
jgi:hypothetical protein